MDILRIRIRNRKANKLLKEMEKQKLIDIESSVKELSFAELLKKLRGKPKTAPIMEEITKEVETVRAKRYAGKASKNNH